MKGIAQDIINCENVGNQILISLSLIPFDINKGTIETVPHRF